MTDTETSQWGIVELMGHKVVAGRVSKSEILGKPMLRVDVPGTTAYPEFTQFYGETAIYCVTFVSEEVARRTAEANKTNPISVYVPDLITRDQLQKVHDEYQERIRRLQRTALSAGGTDEAVPGVADEIEELWEGGEDEEDDD